MPVPDASPTGNTSRIENRIKSLVHYWMAAWDANTGDATPLIEVLSPEGFAIHLSERPDPITDVAGLRAWFAEFPKQVAIDNHYVESIDIEPMETGHHRVRIHVSCPGIARTGQNFLVESDHDWEVADLGGIFPRICSVRVKVARIR